VGVGLPVRPGRLRAGDTPSGPWASGADRRENITSELPTLVLPVNKKVKIKLTSRDVIHSFWIIDFLYKKDMYIGKDNYWSFTRPASAEYGGKCAELCGQYHSMMLFKVKVVERPSTSSTWQACARGQTGDISSLRPAAELPGYGPRRS
jgi:cytochrome c oxidase subunit 2